MPRRDDRDFNLNFKADDGRKRNPVLYFNSRRQNALFKYFPLQFMPES
jgi:hypothetical protein